MRHRRLLSGTLDPVSEQIILQTTQPITLSVLIVNWNTRDLLRGCLQSIALSPPALPYEIIVVDNASSDGSAEMVHDEFPHVTLQANRENAGYALGNNQALERARGTYRLLLNPDVILPPGSLDTAVQFMENHPNAGAMGVKQLHPDGSLQRSLRGFPTPLSVLWELSGLSRLFSRSRVFGAYRMTWFDYEHEIEVDQPMGTFLLLRGKAVDRVGQLDLAFPIFFNEVDWCLRCKRAGWNIYYTPAVEIIHYGGASTMQVGAAMAWESRRGLLNFYRKHYGGLRYLPLRGIIAAASYPHAFLQARKRKR